MNRIRVIIAEDNLLIQESMRGFLQPRFDVAGSVADGAAALQAVAEHHPDVLVVDVSLPLLNGFEVTEKLQNAGSQVNVIFVTAYRERSYMERAFALGARGYLLKGTMRSELPAAIQEVMRGGTYRSPLVDGFTGSVR